jgi:hypothetical protein
MSPLPTTEVAITAIEIGAVKLNQEEKYWEPFFAFGDVWGNNGVTIPHILLELYCP